MEASIARIGLQPRLLTSQELAAVLGDRVSLSRCNILSSRNDALGPSHHFAAMQQSVAFGVPAQPVDHRSKRWIFLLPKSMRPFELGFAFDDPGIGSLFAIDGFCFAVDDDAVFLDHDLGGEGLGAVFASSSYYRAHRGVGIILMSNGFCCLSCRYRSAQSVRRTSGRFLSYFVGLSDPVGPVGSQSVQSRLFGTTFSAKSTTPSFHRGQNRSK
jgi:hypothetical protein